MTKIMGRSTKETVPATPSHETLSGFDRFLDSPRGPLPDIDTNTRMALMGGFETIDYLELVRSNLRETAPHHFNTFTNSAPPAPFSRLNDLLDYMATKRDFYAELGDDSAKNNDLSFRDHYFCKADELSKIIHLAFDSEASGNQADLVFAEIKEYAMEHRRLAELGTPNDINTSLKNCYTEILYKIDMLDM